MERNVLWIGYINQLRALVTEIGLSHGRGVDGAQFAAEGLELAANKQYPLILVNDSIPTTGLVLPEQITLDDGVQIGCHVIKKIRSGGKNRETPVMVTHIGEFPGYLTEKALRMYKEAGATECFNWYCRDPLSEFAGAARKYF